MSHYLFLAITYSEPLSVLSHYLFVHFGSFISLPVEAFT